MQAWLLKPWAKPLVFVLCLLPCAWLTYAAFTDGLGANPAEALLRSTGDWTLRFLHRAGGNAAAPDDGLDSAGALSPHAGSVCVLHACLHLLCYAWFDMGLDWGDIVADIPKRPFILVGFTAWAVLLVLAATSPKWVLRALGASAGSGCTVRSTWWSAGAAAFLLDARGQEQLCRSGCLCSDSCHFAWLACGARYQK